MNSATARTPYGAETISPMIASNSAVTPRQWCGYAILPVTRPETSSASCWLRPGRNPYENPSNISLPRRSRSALQPRSLDDLVFECCDRERALAAVFLRNLAPEERLRPRSCLDPCVQVLDTSIGLPRHAVDAGGRVKLQCIERWSQHRKRCTRPTLLLAAGV